MGGSGIERESVMSNPQPEPQSDREESLVVYFLVLLRKGPRWTPESTPEIEATQAAHLAYMDRLHAEGKLLLAGPFIDSPVDDLRGLTVLAAESHEEALALTAGDPAVQAGRLTMDVIPWATAAGQLAKDGIPLPAFLAARRKE
ncbi:MAG: hypothetical protein Kow0077_08560 [Anaerolineae bacterium]